MDLNKFSHLTGATQFPDLGTVNTYKYQNTFDYTRWDTNTKVKLVNVPWTNEPPYNVPKFADEKACNNYFDTLGGCTVDLNIATRLDLDGIIKLPVPFDVANQFNYVIVDFPIATDANNKIAYETSNGLKTYYYFVEEIQASSAPNCTRLRLSIDWWTTCINQADINYVMLERGHAPLAATTADDFLQNPLENNTYLLADDVNYGSARIVQSATDLVLNDDVWVCIATTASLGLEWGAASDNTWRTPVAHSSTVAGVPSRYVFALEPTDFQQFMTDADDNFPNFKATIEGVFFVSKKLVRVDGAHTPFGRVVIYSIYASQKTFTLEALEKTQFGYEPKYADFAKLYTSPYAHLELCDPAGNVTEVKIEDTTGKIDLKAWCSVAFPALGIDFYYYGAGGKNKRTLTFETIHTERHIQVLGKWYDTLNHLDIPVFNVQQAPYRDYDWQTYYKRQQAKNAYETAYNNAQTSASVACDNAKRSAATSKLNACNSANTAKTNANNSANAAYNSAVASANTAKVNTTNTTTAQTSNAGLQKVANNSQTSASNKTSTDNTATANGATQAQQAYDAGLARAMQTVDQDLQTATAVTTGIANGIQSTVAGAMSGGIGGALAGLIGGVIGGVANGVNTALAINADNAKVEISISNSQNKINSQMSANSTMNSNNVRAANATKNATNTYITGSTTNSVNAANTNASNTQNTSITNAQRALDASNTNASNTQNTSITNANNTQNTSITNADASYNSAITNAARSKTLAENAITNDIRQGGLARPQVYGLNTGNSEPVTLAQNFSCNVVTQSKSAIEQAAAQFARYGYVYKGQWHVVDFNVMQYFSYWKCSEVWFSTNNAIIEPAKKYIRKLLATGVTVWRDPSKIGAVELYEN